MLEETNSKLKYLHITEDCIPSDFYEIARIKTRKIKGQRYSYYISSPPYPNSTKLCILIDKYALFCILFANWHSPATLTEIFPCFFLSCKANYQGIPRKDGTRSALFLISKLCCSMYCCVDCVVICIVCV
jgi:hypothetical protein